MISSVTSATVSTITSAALAVSLGAVSVALVIAFLVVKELASNGDNPKLQTLSRTLNISIYPLLFAFAATVAQRVMTAI
jgi:hypothetical protein